MTDHLEGTKIARWIDGIKANLVGRLLPVDGNIAAQWGRIQSPNERPFMEMLIAATAIVYGLTLVTQNVHDFANLNLEIKNPWL